MKFNHTQHFKKRLRQRGRSDSDIRLIDKYGEHRRGVCLLTRRQVKRTIGRLRRWLKRHASARVQKRVHRVREIICRLEKLTDWMLIISPAGDAVTVYRADKRRQSRFMRGQCRPVDHGNPYER